jgi:hypothetical protein
MWLLAITPAIGVATVWIVGDLQAYAERHVACKHQDD